MMNKVRVWDLPTRVFHWLLAVCVIGLAVTGTIGGGLMEWHFRFGYAVLSLLLFRLVWGVIGGRWSRFASFIYSPGSMLAYLRGRGKPEHSVGHNPLGAGSVFALLLFLCAQVGTGLMSDDEIAFAGPLTRFVSNATVSAATSYHKGIGKYVLLALVVLHLLAIVFYVWKKKHTLVRPMLHGDKHLPIAVESARDNAGTRVLALVIFGMCVGVAGWLSKLGS